MDTYIKRRLELKDKACISLSKNFYSLAVESGEYENLSYSENGCQKYIRKAWQLKLGVGDVEAFGNYFNNI